MNTETNSFSTYKRINFFKRMAMPLSDLEQYYAEKRKYDFENGRKISGYKYRKFLHPLLLGLIKVDKLLSREKIIITNNSSQPTDKPVIFACTHIGGNDIIRTFEVLGKQAYLFLGDPKGLYKDFSGLMLYLNGAIMLETRNKTDRNIGYHRCVEILKNKQNLLIFPEGAWNISPNELVMKLFPGTVRMALESNSIIIPIALEQYENNFYFNIGENVDYSDTKYCDYTIKQLTDDLRNRIATLKYHIIENHTDCRSDISNEYIENFTEEIISRVDWDYTVQDVIETRFNDKTITSCQEAFAHLKRLKPCSENAFLFNKRMKGI